MAIQSPYTKSGFAIGTSGSPTMRTLQLTQLGFVTVSW